MSDDGGTRQESNGSEGSGDASESSAAREPSGAEDAEPESDRESGVESSTGGEGSDADPRDRYEGPLGELAAEVDARTGRTDDFDDLFEREEITPIDEEALWDRLEREGDPFDEDLLVEREVREIPKRAYCHRCEHFSAPPELSCTNDGTDILELPSLDTFRVADCPVVLEDEALEDGT